MFTLRFVHKSHSKNIHHISNHILHQIFQANLVHKSIQEHTLHIKSLAFFKDFQANIVIRIDIIIPSCPIPTATSTNYSRNADYTQRQGPTLFQDFIQKRAEQGSCRPTLARLIRVSHTISIPLPNQMMRKFKTTGYLLQSPNIMHFTPLLEGEI